MIILDQIQEAHDHIYDVEVKALELECMEEGFVRGFLKGIHLVHRKTRAEIKWFTPSQASGDSSVDFDGDEVERFSPGFIVVFFLPSLIGRYLHGFLYGFDGLLYTSALLSLLFWVGVLDFVFLLVWLLFFINFDMGSSLNVGKDVVIVNTGKGTTVNVGKGGVGVDVKPKGKPVIVHASPFDAYKQYAATDTQLHDNSAVVLFFLRQDLRRCKQFTLQLADGGGAARAFIPRSSAEFVPFSTEELPAILSRFSIPVGSAEAAATEKTLRECEAAPVVGEKKLCATSLESMVDFATTSLGTRKVVAVATEGGSGDRRVYKVRSVRTVAAAGGKGVVSCHPEAYVYAVFFCHTTASSEVYEVEMAAEGGGTGMKAVAPWRCAIRIRRGGIRSIWRLGCLM
ncbi:hypothetical protein M5K25_024290 [Dendrobium thyrsiflorum]|uniref:BURP domain-containing protein n=1 Tax=Dendrobium thyrsiflorum TaxID=117978 RepID=A0ABD0U1W4_DENTH